MSMNDVQPESDPVAIVQRPDGVFEPLPEAEPRPAETPPPESDADPHAEKAARLDAYLSRIFASAAVVREKRTTYEVYAERAKSAKKSWESAAEAHAELESDLERERGEPATPGPLFEGPKAESADGEADAWRSVPIDALASYGLTESTVALLAESAVATMGALADYTAQGPLTDLAGIGPARAAEIEDACTAFWAARAPTEAEAENPVPAENGDSSVDAAIDAALAPLVADGTVEVDVKLGGRERKVRRGR